MKNSKEQYLKSIDDLNFKIWLFERYLKDYPCDNLGIEIKDRYNCILKKMLVEFENVYGE